MAKRRLLVAAPLILLTAALVLGLLWAKGEEGIVKYTLYIGLNDKDTYRQEIPADEAEALVEKSSSNTPTGSPDSGRRVLTRMPKGSLL